MKYAITIIFILFFVTLWLVSFCQDTAIWRVGNEAIVYQYQVQKTRDTTGTWVTIASVDKGKNSYWYILPHETNYYRIKASGKQTFVTKPILLTVTENAVTIKTTSVKPYTTSDFLTWTVTKEINVNYYLMDRSTGGAYTQLKQVPARGYSKYSLYVTRITGAKYRITPVFKDGRKGTTKNF